jgi:hypothetical protein
MIYSILIGFLCTVFYFLLDTILTHLIDYKFYILNLFKLLFVSIRRRVLRFVMNNRPFKRLRTSSSKMLASASQTNEDRAQLGSFKVFEFVRIKIAKRSEYSRLLPGSDLIDSAAAAAKNGVPKKRSGHRCVCNEENLWIWGGYCPIEELSDNDNEDDEETNNEPAPIFAEVFIIIFQVSLASIFIFY